MNLSPHLFIAACLLVITQTACRKDDVNQVQQPSGNAQKVDSGTYDPNSYFPLKYGMEWLYENQDGKFSTRVCGPRILDSVLVSYPNYATDTGHILNLEFGGQDFVKPGGVKIFRYVCSKPSSVVNENFVQPYWPKGFIQRIDVTCPMGPPPYPRFLIAEHDDTTVNGYTEVKAFSSFGFNIMEKAGDSANYAQWNGWMDHMLAAPPNNQLKPYAFEMKDSVIWTTNYYAKGIGLVRRELYDKGKLVLEFDLVSVSIPK